MCNVVQTRNIIPQDFLILVIRKKSSWGLGRRWKGRGQWVGGDIIAPPRHPPISTHPPPRVPKSQSYLVPEFLRTHLFNSALWWTHQIVFSDFYKILVPSLHNFFLDVFSPWILFWYEHCMWVTVQTGCVVMLVTIAPFFCRKFRDIRGCKVVWVGVDIISVELPLPTFLQFLDQYHHRCHHHPRHYHHHHCHHKFRHHKYCRNFVSYILLRQKSDTQFVKYFTPACFHIIQNLLDQNA